jgi:hypothetical protein
MAEPTQAAAPAAASADPWHQVVDAAGAEVDKDLAAHDQGVADQRGAAITAAETADAANAGITDPTAGDGGALATAPGVAAGFIAKDVAESAGAGVLKGLFTAKDLFLGEPNYEDKSKFRTEAEGAAAELARRSTVNGLATGVAQFGVGFMGLGFIRKGGLVVDSIRAGVGAALTMDPHADRLSNWLEQYPAMRNPVTGYLAADPADGAMTGRFKNAIENLLIPAGIHAGTTAASTGVRGLTNAFTKALDSIKLRATGNPAAAEAAQSEASTLFAKVEHDGHLDGETSAPTPLAGEVAAHGPEAAGEGDLPRWKQRILDRNASAEKANSDGAPSEQAPVAGPGVEGEAAPSGQVGDVPPTGSAVRPVPANGDGGGGLHGKPLDGEALPSTTIAPEDLAKYMAKARGDQEAISHHGSIGAAQNAGHIFSGPDLIPWNKFTAADEVMTWMDGVVHDNAATVHAARGGNEAGVMTDAQVTSMIENRVRVTGEDPAILRGMLLQAGKDAKSFPANMETAYLLSQKGFQDTYTLAQKFEAGNFAGFQSEEHAYQALKDRMVGSLDMFAAAKAMTAAGARATRRMGMTAMGEDLVKVDVSGMTGKDLQDLLIATKGDPAAIASITKPLLNRIVDFATMNQAAGLLWGWASQTVNSVMNVANLYTRPILQAAGSSVIKGVAAVKGDEALLASAGLIQRQAVREIMVTHTMLADGWNAAVFAFMRGDSRIAPHTSEVTAAGAGAAARPGSGPLADAVNIWKDTKTIDDVLYNATASAMEGLSLPLRAMGAADEMVKTMRYRAIVLSEAHLEAVDAGLAPGSQAYADHLTAAGRSAFDESGAATNKMALEEARATAYQEGLIGSTPTTPSGLPGPAGAVMDALGGSSSTWGGYQSIGKMVQTGVASIPPLRFAVPFVQTPANIFRQGIRLTPGLNLLQKQYLNEISGIAGTAAQARATGEMMLGIMFASSATALVLNGNVTGAGPSDPKEAQAWRDAGNQADSFVWHNADGTKKFFQLNRWDPLEAPFIWYAELVTYLKQGHIDETKAETAVTAPIIATMNMFKNKTMLSNLDAALQAFGSEDKANTFFKRAGPGMVLPASSLMKMTNPDPYLREVNNMWEGIKADIPGASRTLPARHDPYGDKVTIGGAIVNGEGPDHGKFTSAQDPRYKELNQALDESFQATGHYIQGPNPRLSSAQFDMRDLKLENGRSAFERFSELAGHPAGAPSLKDTLSNIVQSGAYKAAPHGASSMEGTKENMLSGVISKYHTGAEGALTAESPIFAAKRSQAMMDTFSSQQYQPKDLKSVQGGSAAKSLNDLLGKAGIGLSVPVPDAQPITQPGR